MAEALIRVRDFAKMCGCTPQNIYGHLKTYKEELDGHTFQGKGRQGVLLDEHAQGFLRSIMYPKELADNSLMEEIEELRKRILNLGLANTELASRLATTEGERDKAVYEAGHYQRALAASQEAEEAKEAELSEAKAAAAENALRASQEAQRAEEAIREAEDLRSQLEASVAREKALKGRNWWERLTRKGES